jgi:hypothetical protein
MKYAMFAALSMYSLFAAANGAIRPSDKLAVQAQQYDYTQDLDIAKVVRISNAANPDKACGPVKAQMDYVDSKGITHRLEYTFLGGGCQNG